MPSKINSDRNQGLATWQPTRLRTRRVTLAMLFGVAIASGFLFLHICRNTYLRREARFVFVTPASPNPGNLHSPTDLRLHQRSFAVSRVARSFDNPTAVQHIDVPTSTGIPSLKESSFDACPTIVYITGVLCSSPRGCLLSPSSAAAQQQHGLPIADFVKALCTQAADRPRVLLIDFLPNIQSPLSTVAPGLVLEVCLREIEETLAELHEPMIAIKLINSTRVPEDPLVNRLSRIFQSSNLLHSKELLLAIDQEAGQARWLKGKGWKTTEFVFTAQPQAEASPSPVAAQTLAGAPGSVSKDVANKLAANPPSDAAFQAWLLKASTESLLDYAWNKHHTWSNQDRFARTVGSSAWITFEQSLHRLHVTRRITSERDGQLRQELVTLASNLRSLDSPYPQSTSASQPDWVQTLSRWQSLEAFNQPSSREQVELRALLRDASLSEDRWLSALQRIDAEVQGEEAWTADTNWAREFLANADLEWPLRRRLLQLRLSCLDIRNDLRTHEIHDGSLAQNLIRIRQACEYLGIFQPTLDWRSRLTQKLDEAEALLGSLQDLKTLLLQSELACLQMYAEIPYWAQVLSCHGQHDSLQQGIDLLNQIERLRRQPSSAVRSDLATALQKLSTMHRSWKQHATPQSPGVPLQNALMEVEFGLSTTQSPLFAPQEPPSLERSLQRCRALLLGAPYSFSAKEKLASQLDACKDAHPNALRGMLGMWALRFERATKDWANELGLMVPAKVPSQSDMARFNCLRKMLGIWTSHSDHELSLQKRRCQLAHQRILRLIDSELPLADQHTRKLLNSDRRHCCLRLKELGGKPSSVSEPVIVNVVDSIDLSTASTAILSVSARNRHSNPMDLEAYLAFPESSDARLAGPVVVSARLETSQSHDLELPCSREFTSPGNSSLHLVIRSGDFKRNFVVRTSTAAADMVDCVTKNPFIPGRADCNLLANQSNPISLWLKNRERTPLQLQIELFAWQGRGEVPRGTLESSQCEQWLQRQPAQPLAKSAVQNWQPQQSKAVPFPPLPKPPQGDPVATPRLLVLVHDVAAKRSQLLEIAPRILRPSRYLTPLVHFDRDACEVNVRVKRSGSRINSAAQITVACVDRITNEVHRQGRGEIGASAEEVTIRMRLSPTQLLSSYLEVDLDGWPCAFVYDPSQASSGELQPVTHTLAMHAHEAHGRVVLPARAQELRVVTQIITSTDLAMPNPNLAITGLDLDQDRFLSATEPQLPISNAVEASLRWGGVAPTGELLLESLVDWPERTLPVNPAWNVACELRATSAAGDRIWSPGSPFVIDHTNPNITSVHIADAHIANGKGNSEFASLGKPAQIRIETEDFSLSNVALVEGGWSITGNTDFDELPAKVAAAKSKDGWILTLPTQGLVSGSNLLLVRCHDQAGNQSKTFTAFLDVLNAIDQQALATSQNPPLRGRLVARKTPVAAAKVKLLDEDQNELLPFVSTDIQGAFQFGKLPAGSYVLVAEGMYRGNRFQRKEVVQLGQAASLSPVIIDISKPGKAP